MRSAYGSMRSCRIDLVPSINKFPFKAIKWQITRHQFDGFYDYVLATPADAAAVDRCPTKKNIQFGVSSEEEIYAV